MKNPAVMPNTTYNCSKQPIAPLISSGAISTKETVLTAMACPAPTPVTSLATINVERLKDEAEMIVPRRVMKLPAKMPRLREMRSDTWPEARDEKDADRRMEAT